MKRKLILILLSFIGVTFLNAQVPVSMSVKPGINISKVVFTEADYEDGDYLGHLYTGVNLEFINDKHLSLLAETGLTVKTYDYLYFSPLFKVRWKHSTFAAYLGMKAYFGASPEKNRRGYNYKMF